MIIHKGLSPYHDIGILYSKLQSRQGCHFAIPDTNAHRMIGRVPVDQVSLSFAVRLITPIEVVEGIDPSFHSHRWLSLLTVLDKLTMSE